MNVPVSLTREMIDLNKAVLAHVERLYDLHHWDALIAAKDRLVALVDEGAYHEDFLLTRKGPVYRALPFRDDVSEEESIDLTIGHFGLGAQFKNGPQSLVYGLIPRDGIANPRKLKRVLDNFDAPSQLVGADHARGFVARLGLSPTETVRERLQNAADDIETWRRVNADRLSVDLHTGFDHAIGDYRFALKSVLEWVDQGNALLASRTEKVGTHAL